MVAARVRGRWGNGDGELWPWLLRARGWRNEAEVQCLERRSVNDLDFSSKGKSIDMNYNVIAHEGNPSHYQLLDDIIVIHRRITSYKVLQHLLTHLLHHNLAKTHASSLECCSASAGEGSSTKIIRVGVGRQRA
jgi:hypothetical protein